MVAQNANFIHPLLIRDDTGDIIVDLKEAELDKPDYLNVTDLSSEVSDEVINFMKKNNIDYAKKTKMRFQEWFFGPDDTVYVFGSVKKNRAIDKSGFDGQLRQNLKELKNDPVEMKKLDVDNDQTISVEEWDAAVQTMRQKLKGELVELKDVHAGASLIIGKGEEGILVLSKKNIKLLNQKYSRSAVFQIIFGLFFCAIF